MSENHSEADKLTPKFFFLSLGVLVTLITSVVSFLSLAFEVLNKQFPDVLNSTYQYGYSSWSYDTIRGTLATLIIVFPVFLVLSYFWTKSVRKNLGSIDKVIKKWMLYLLIFLSSIVIIVDLVTLVRYFVSGEITERFLYKVGITLVVALYVAVYYIFVLKDKNKMFGIPVSVSASIKSSVIVLALVVWSFSVIGSPKEQRAWRLDDRRVQDLQSIQWQVINYWQQKEKLPENISELSNPLSGSIIPVDPEFEKGVSYEYRKTGDMKFELCATFSAEMPKGWQEYSGGGVRPLMNYAEDAAISYPYPGGGVNDSWDHSAGKKCFERTIDPDIYPPYPKQDRVY